jgi:hypothetical protein
MQPCRVRVKWGNKRRCSKVGISGKVSMNFEFIESGKTRYKMVGQVKRGGSSGRGSRLLQG